MLGGFLPWRLFRNPSSCIRISVIKANGNACSHGFGDEYRWICPGSSIFASKYEPWEQFRQMGGGPRTFPGGLNKWQWKRFHEKKAREKEKKLLQQERQLYEARIRSNLRGQLLETSGHFNNDNNDDDNNAVVEQGSTSFGPMTPKDQVMALANRFMKAGAEDLWNEDDGPLTTNPKPSSSLVQGNGIVTGFKEEQDSLGNGKMYRRTPIKDSLRKNGSSSFSRNFSSGPRRSRGSARAGRYSDDEEMVQKRSRFETVGRDSDEGGVRQKYGYKSNRVERWSDDEDEGQKHARRRSAPPKSLVEDEMELGSLIDAEMESGIRFEDDLLRSDRTGRRDFYEEGEKEFRQAKPGGRRRESISLNSDLRSKRRSLRNFHEEDDETESSWSKLGGMAGSTSKYAGSRTRRQSLKDFDEGDETEFRWPKSTERGRYISNHSGLLSNGDNNRRESRHPKLKRMGDSMSDYSGSRSKRQPLKDSDEEEKEVFGQPNPRGMRVSMPKHSGSRSERQSLRDLDEDNKAEFRQSEREAGLLRYNSRSKRRGPRDMEDDKDEEESGLDLDRQLPLLDVLKKEQLKKGATEKECLKAQNSKNSKEKEESYLSQTR